ncbi:hypothetical protein DE146DRAFT_655143 [Phaeosphaeria sp. MPI-PUGE-AT-0046c]|nr:hypothetical protein DE146DRAFT_655143 [Phaeosphaeria sp. MPI-PUGE-AT-0046c]
MDHFEDSYKPEITTAQLLPCFRPLPYFSAFTVLITSYRQASELDTSHNPPKTHAALSNMVSYRNLFASALAVSIGATLGATLPAPDDSLRKRRVKKDIVLAILKAIGASIDDTVYTWDVNRYKQYCDVYMETLNGGNCYATVECQEGGKLYYKNWDKCYVAGVNNFEDPRLGPFSIGFRKRDGAEGEGLTDPVIITTNNWLNEDVKAYDVTKLASAYRSADRCDAGIAPLNCDSGPFLCRWVDYNIWSNRKKQWSCGIPIKGDHSLDELELPAV